MIKSLFVGAALALGAAFTSFAQSYSVPSVPPLGNSHLHVGGGASRITSDTNVIGTNFINGALSSTFVWATTNKTIRGIATNFVDGQRVDLYINNLNGTNSQFTFDNTGMIYSIPSNHVSVVGIQLVDGTYHSRLQGVANLENGVYNTVTVTNGVAITSNAPACWPGVAPHAGSLMLVSSNGSLFLLSAPINSTTWATPKLIGP